MLIDALTDIDTHHMMSTTQWGAQNKVYPCVRSHSYQVILWPTTLVPYKTHLKF